VKTPLSSLEQAGNEDEAVLMQSTQGERSAPSEESRLLEDIPMMLEKVEQEEEKECYPASTYLLSALCAAIGGLLLILGITSGILYDTYSESIDYSKLAALLLIILCLEGYLFRKIWDKKNRRSKIITKSEYIDPRTEADYSAMSDYKRKPILAAKLQGEPVQIPRRVAEPDQKVWLQKGEQKEELEEDYNPTCLLSEAGKKTEALKLCLRPVTDPDYQPILLTEYPFFIGKLKTNVDYCLDQKVISRYHAKITKEEERYYITDLNSTNGTFVNGQMLQTYEKKEIILGDEIAFANISYVFEKQ
jgi:hypothetical protein